jgi:type IV secretion system protein VirB10
VFHRAILPRVRQPTSPWTLALGIVGVGVAGVLAFTSLSSAREARTSSPKPMVAAAPPALRGDLAPPPPAPVAPAVAPVMQVAAAAMPTPPQAPAVDPAEANLHAPAVVVDLGDAHATGAAAAKPGGPGADDAHATADERFAARMSASAVETAQARQMHNLNRLVPQGAMIPAVLETAIDSDLPGSVRAVVSRDVRGFDGSQVLVPRGSMLIGQYKSAAAVGQTRAFVVWSRLITPSGVSVEISSPATDQLGRGGLDGETNTHFFQRFGASILLSVITSSIDVLANRGSNNTNTAIAIGSPMQASRLADIALQKQIEIPATIRVPPGQAVQVFVARDLDFSAVATPAR